jgi:hypothetical protein
LHRARRSHLIGRVANDGEKTTARHSRRFGARSLFTGSRTAGRCPVCGQEVSTGDDFVHVHGEAAHTDCAVHRYGGQSGPERWRR